MSVEIFVARHGQNEDNVARILGGHRDKPLTDVGRQQARDLAQGIVDAELMFNAVYCSPLIRAHETADIIAEVAVLPKPEVMSDLIERNGGVIEGMTFDEIERTVTFNMLKTNTVNYFLDPEGAETFPELVVRGRGVLDQIRRKHSEGKVLLVCHGDIGKMIYAAATGKDWKEVLMSFHLGNAELIDIGKHNDAHVVKLDQFNH